MQIECIQHAIFRRRDLAEQMIFNHVLSQFRRTHFLHLLFAYEIWYTHKIEGVSWAWRPVDAGLSCLEDPETRSPFFLPARPGSRSFARRATEHDRFTHQTSHAPAGAAVGLVACASALDERLPGCLVWRFFASGGRVKCRDGLMSGRK